MNEFQSIESGQGMLKNQYDSGEKPTERALKERRRKMAAKLKIEQAQEQGNV